MPQTAVLAPFSKRVIILIGKNGQMERSKSAVPVQACGWRAAGAAHMSTCHGGKAALGLGAFLSVTVCPAVPVPSLLCSDTHL